MRWSLLVALLAFRLISRASAAEAREKITCGDIGFTSSEEDCDIAKQSKEINGQKCPSEPVGDDVRGKLEDAMHGDNKLRQNLETAKDDEEFNEKLGEDMTGTYTAAHCSGLSISWLRLCYSF